MTKHNYADLVTEKQKRRIMASRWAHRVLSNGTVSAAVMVLAAIAAVACANTDWYFVIHEFLHSSLSFSVGEFSMSISVEAFINDFLMAIFFLLVGIELKYEVTVGELRRPKQAMLPMLAAVGGVVVPACIYGVLNRGGAIHGWAIPMATDIAFALGVLSLLGNKVPNSIKVFFTTLAIADDLLAIAAIALFYGQAPSMFWLACSAVTVVVLIVLNRRQVFNLRPYLAVGLLLWFFMFQSGIHATLAGVILAFCIPARTDIRTDSLVDWMYDRLPDIADRYDDEKHILGQHDFTAAVNNFERVAHRVTPPLQRLENKISLPVNYLILPIFAFANAQVRLVGADMSALMVDPVTLGTYFGMVLGKPLGIFGVTYLLVKVGLADLPRNVNWHHIAGVGILGGIGFTMSILIAGLAFPAVPAEQLASKTAILAASVSAAVIGVVYMNHACKNRDSSGESHVSEAAPVK